MTQRPGYPQVLRLVQILSLLLTIGVIAFVAAAVYQSWNFDRTQQTIGGYDPVAVKESEQRFRQKVFAIPVPMLRLPFWTPNPEPPTPIPQSLPLQTPELPAPTQLEISAKQIERLIREGEFLPAITLLKTALTQESDSARLHKLLTQATSGHDLMERGKREFFSGEYDNAMLTFQQVSLIAPQNQRIQWFKEQIVRLRSITPLPTSRPTVAGMQERAAVRGSQVPSIVPPVPAVLSLEKLSYPDKIIRGEPLKISIKLKNPQLASAVLLHYETEDQHLQTLRMTGSGPDFEATIPKKHVRTRWLSITINVIGLDGTDVLEPIKKRIEIEDVLPQAPPI